jgi:hypothetical protein
LARRAVATFAPIAAIAVAGAALGFCAFYRCSYRHWFVARQVQIGQSSQWRSVDKISRLRLAGFADGARCAFAPGVAVAAFAALAPWGAFAACVWRVGVGWCHRHIARRVIVAWRTASDFSVVTAFGAALRALRALRALVAAAAGVAGSARGAAIAIAITGGAVAGCAVTTSVTAIVALAATAVAVAAIAPVAAWFALRCWRCWCGGWCWCWNGCGNWRWCATKTK